jgi:hypothetical protein
MNQHRIMLKKRGMFYVWLLFAMFTTAAIVFACKKTNAPEAAAKSPAALQPGGWNNAAVKDWFYGTFKKKALWAGYDAASHGAKVPDWEHGTAFTLGGFSFIEFPLIKEKSRFPVPSSQLTTEQMERVANASLSRIAFIRKANGEILIREIDYVPDWGYLQKKNFDISQVRMGNKNFDFTGMMYIRSWSGALISEFIMKEGRFSKKGTDRKGSEAAKTSGVCGVLVTELEQYCIDYYQNDKFVGEHCGDWQPTGDYWFIQDPCEDEDPCMGSEMTPDCACSTLNICDDQDQDEDCHAVDPNEVASGFSQADDVTEQSGGIVEDAYGHQSMLVRFDWVFHKGSFMWYTLNFVAHEEGTKEPVDGIWVWKNFHHEGVTKEGYMPFTVICDLTSLNTHISADKTIAKVSFNYSLTIKMSCGPYTAYNSPFVISREFPA